MRRRRAFVQSCVLKSLTKTHSSIPAVEHSVVADRSKSGFRDLHTISRLRLPPTSSGMSAQLIERIDQACKENPSLLPLAAQWSFDQQLIGKALQNVAIQFPHYSRHDESHSVQILTNIERVLGSERIAQLSGTDVWLMLEAAYLHDVGMVVSQQQKQQDWSSEEFRPAAIRAQQQRRIRGNLGRIAKREYFQ